MKWQPLVVSHISKTIVLVHEYISELLIRICPGEQIRVKLWNDLLIDRLRDAYRGAMAHAHFLLTIERGGRPMTFNHYFNSNLRTKRSDRMAKTLRTIVSSLPGGYSGEHYVSASNIDKQAAEKDHVQQICEDIVDTLASYYDISRKRFVDVICQQVIAHLLLEGDPSPLKILSSDLIMGLGIEQLESIAGENERSMNRRQDLERKIASLEAASKELR